MGPCPLPRSPQVASYNTVRPLALLPLPPPMQRAILLRRCCVSASYSRSRRAGMITAAATLATKARCDPTTVLCAPSDEGDECEGKGLTTLSYSTFTSLSYMSRQQPQRSLLATTA